MRISSIIERLRTNMPPLAGQSWGNRIAGGADLPFIEDEQRLANPALLVWLGPDRARTPSRPGAFNQELTESFVVVAVLSQQDRRGQAVQDLVEDIRTGLFVSLLNWVYDTNNYSIEYVGSRFLKADRARYFHQFEFQMVSRLTEQDGVQLTLDNFDRLYADWNLPESDPLNYPDIQDAIEGIYNYGQ